MKVAVLLATYNGEKYIKTQIDSLLNQTFHNFELFISDDGSTDNTLEILKEYAFNRHNIHILEKHEPNGSACKNFLYLLENVNSDLYLFCDQDDEWFSDHIENLVRTFEINRKEGVPLLIHSDLMVVDRELNIINDSFFKFSSLSKNPLPYHYYLVQNNVTGCTMAINQELKEKAILNLSTENRLKIPMHDWWLALVAARFGEIIFIENKGLKYRQHGGNEVGAKNVNSFSYVFNRFFNRAANRRSVSMSRNLVSVYLSVFDNVLENEEKKVLSEYISPDKYSKLRRILFLKKNRLERDTLKRKLMQILYI